MVLLRYSGAAYARYQLLAVTENRGPPTSQTVLRKFYHIHDTTKMDMNCLLCFIGSRICLAVGFFPGWLAKENWATENRHEDGNSYRAEDYHGISRDNN